jgi:phosphoribosylglycinamide formyltransferase 1
MSSGPSRPRLGILLSGSGSTYANLVTAGVPADVAVVIGSRPGLGGLAKAVTFGHPTVVASEPEAVTAALRAHGATWVVMCGWLKYWDPPGEFRGRTVNIHPSLLPAFGGPGMYGRKVHESVIAHGVKITGCTVHLVAGGYDSGPILAQAAVAVAPDDTPDTLQARVQAAERTLYPRAITDLLQCPPTTTKPSNPTCPTVG